MSDGTKANEKGIVVDPPDDPPKPEFSSGSTPRTPKSPSLIQMSSSETTNSESPDERSKSAPYDSPPKSRSSATERIVAPNRNILPLSSHSRLFTDSESFYPWGYFNPDDPDSDAKLREVAEDLLKRSLGLELPIKEPRIQLALGEGQAFLVATGNGHAIVTVKHNFCKETTKAGKLEECLLAFVVYPDKSVNSFPFDPNQQPLLNWDANGLTPKGEGAFQPTSWKYGHELLCIGLNQQKGSDELLEAVAQDRIRAFEVVPRAFEIEVGVTRVGVLARSHGGLLARELCSELGSRQPGEEERYEAKPGDVFITVGLVTHVGGEHIEYDVNTVPGFSGAPVILLDPGSDDHMKVIAVHGGFSETKETNFGFLVANEVGQRHGAATEN